GGRNRRRALLGERDALGVRKLERPRRDFGDVGVLGDRPEWLVARWFEVRDGRTRAQLGPHVVRIAALLVPRRLPRLKRLDHERRSFIERGGGPAVVPPSTGSVMPVICAARSLARNNAASATSRGVPCRCSGCIAAMILDWSNVVLIAVGMCAGAMQLTRMLW